MSEISRREFVINMSTCAAVAGLVSATGLPLHANPLGMPIGCQTWPVRKMIAKDFPGTIKLLAAAGFQTIELCSPVGYADEGFAGLAKYKGAELKKILSDAGVSCVSSHFGIGELRENQDARHRLGERCRAHANARPQPGGPEKSHHGRRETSRRRVQQDRLSTPPKLASSRVFTMKTSSFPRSTASELTTYCLDCSTPSW